MIITSVTGMVLGHLLAAIIFIGWLIESVPKIPKRIPFWNVKIRGKKEEN
ncbi:hypothetical protein M316_0030 [Nitrincola phage 1M3-16]|nr:hypothetical protein GJ22_gp122 [Nitrincola phage 1M3-16]AHX01095.1 hypothetical protein M316_0030 [Nitrincola phage 1M3-16]